MARYTKPPAAPREIGSIGGITFQKAGSQFILRIRNAPVDKRSISQIEQRQRFAAMASQWRERSTPEKDSFGNEVINYPRQNSLGQTYFQPENALFLGSNLNVTQSETVAVTTMPAPVTNPIQNSNLNQMDFSASEVIYRMTINPIPVNTSLTVEMSAPLPITPGNVSDTEVKVIRIWQAGEDTNASLFNEYLQAWGSFQNMVGFKVFMRARNISNLSGQLINSFQTLVTIIG